MIATGLCVPIAAGCIDLAVGTEVGLGGILVAWMLADHGFAIVPAIALALLAGALIGLANGLLVIKGRMDSFIATMGMSSVLTAMIAWPSGGTQILNLKPSFESLGTNELFGVTYPVYILLVVAVVVWYILERTPAGRRVYATGGNIEAARLSGVPTSRVIVISLAVSATIAAAAGVLETSQLATGDPTVGPAYLIPAIAAVFLGSTQFRGGRVNVAGTIVAVYVLAVGVKGLQLAGAPVWLPDLFNGVALLIAVGLSRYERTAARSAAIKKVLPRLRRRREHESATPSQ
jgi:ribose transport system permease protein